MQRSFGGIAVLGMLAGCAVEGDDGQAPPDEVIATPSRFDFGCHRDPLPDRADSVVTLHGFTNDSYTGAGLPGVMVDLVAKASDAVLERTASDAGGALVFEVATGSAPVDLYTRMTRDGHVTSYLYPSRPLVEDQENVFFPVLPPEWRAELAAFAGVELDADKGIVAVIVTDCAGERVDGATVTFDPPAEAIAYWDATFTDASADRTTINGHAWGFNVPAGTVHATITVDGITYRDWPVKSFVDGRTISWRAP